MKAKSRQSGLTLMEMATVVAIVALLTVFAVPAMRTFFDSLGSAGSVKGMISTALASARAIAAKESKYVGIRFQEDLNGHQYMVFVIHEEPKKMGGLTIGFRAKEGIQPIRLPDNIGVMDLTIVTDRRTGTFHYDEVRLDDVLLNPDQDGWIDSDIELTDTTTFSIVFSQTGKLVINEIRVWNRDGERDTIANSANISYDDVFNKKQQVDRDYKGYDIYANPPGAGMLYQDDYYGVLNNPYGNLGFGPELSRRSFIIYDKIQFSKIDWDKRWSDYLSGLDVIYINPYTGTIVSMD
ncbi:MAG: pilus assembly FimT family protein [Planctomycetota bacterium]|jgi:prepilin-type N-terminal cleavage/methylation domain-containing protein